MISPRMMTGGFAATNGYLHQTAAGAVMIDAPSGSLEWLQELGVKPAALLLTHQHYDHVEDAAAIQSWADCPVHAFAPYAEELTLVPLLRAVGMEMEIAPYRVDHLIAPGKPLDLPGVACEVAHIPGHATDSLTFYFPGDQLVFTGDTLMAGGIGRTDLPGGSWDLLRAGITGKLFQLPAATRVFPGHGGSSTIGLEKSENPFLR